MHTRFIIAILGIFILTTTVTAQSLIPAKNIVEPVASDEIYFLTKGAPSDSMALRVSLGRSQGLRDSSWYVIIEERSSFPPPIVLVTDPDTRVTSKQEVTIDKWWYGAVRIEGSYLNKVRLNTERIQEHSGDRWPEYRQRQLEFGGWLSPRQFVIKEKYGCFVIRWLGRQEYELVEVLRY